jgi:large subunit ribosomal protein L25
MTGVDINCLAKDLPEYIEVDVSALEIGDSIHLSHIKLSKGVEIPALAQGPDHDLPVISINAPKGGAAEEEAGEEAAAEEGGE